MSKVKGNIFDLNKTKLRGNLRRIETKKKKHERIKKSQNYIYRFQRGYYAKDWKYISEYELIEVPETYVDTYHIEKITKKDYDSHPEAWLCPKGAISPPWTPRPLYGCLCLGSNLVLRHYWENPA